jgi:hypothetical protein
MVASTLKSAEALLKKYHSIKPNTQQLKKPLDKVLDKASKKEEEFTKEENSSMETPTVDMSEIGCVIFIYAFQTIFFIMNPCSIIH